MTIAFQILSVVLLTTSVCIAALCFLTLLKSIFNWIANAIYKIMISGEK